MIAGCLLTGMIPWLLKETTKINLRYLNWVTIFGAGLLCGVCLIMILPEGVEQVFELENYPCETPNPSQLVGTTLVCGFILNMLCDKVINMFKDRNNMGAGIAIAIGMFI